MASLEDVLHAVGRLEGKVDGFQSELARQQQVQVEQGGRILENERKVDEHLTRHKQTRRLTGFAASVIGAGVTMLAFLHDVRVAVSGAIKAWFGS